MHKDDMFREGLIKLRKSKDMSLREFSQLTGISHTNLARYEKGHHGNVEAKKSIDLNDLWQICERSGYPFKQFLEEAGYFKPIAPNEVEFYALAKEVIAEEGLPHTTPEQVELTVAAITKALMDGKEPNE